MVIKHWEIKVDSSWRALDACAFFKSFLRLTPLRPTVLNFRMFSRLRLILAFLALVRHANRGVTGAADVRGVNAGKRTKACREKESTGYSGFRSYLNRTQHQSTHLTISPRATHDIPPSQGREQPITREYGPLNSPSWCRW
jgi:hypothetical protein